jgi:hypothetical protein
VFSNVHHAFNSDLPSPLLHNIYKQPDVVSFPPSDRCANHLFDGIPPAHFIFSVLQTIPPVDSATGEGSGNSSKKTVFI